MSTINETTWHKKQRELGEIGRLWGFTEGQETDYQLYCDNCFLPSLIAVHGHYQCTSCGSRTSCCEGTLGQL